MIAACYANPNWDGKDNAEKRKEYLKLLNEHFNQAIDKIHNPDGPVEVDVDWNNPFYAAHKREIARTREAFALALGDGDSTAGEVLEAEESNGHGKLDYDQYVPPE
jgi:hypothetical protein